MRFINFAVQEIVLNSTGAEDYFMSSFIASTSTAL
jgi:hypothetical protein